MPTRLQIRRDSASGWTSVNPTLASGEIGFETDTRLFKVGDGSTAWSSLLYSSGTLPAHTAPSQTADGYVVWDSDDNLLTVGTGSGRKTMVDTDSSQSVSNKTLVAPVGTLANMEVYTSGTSWTVPTALRTVGAKWKVTLVGGGGGGGGTNITAGQVGGGGGSGGVVVGFFTYASGQDAMTFAVGAAGTAGASNANGGNGGGSTATYNGITFTAGGGNGGVANGAAGTGGTATGGTLNLVGDGGDSGGTMAATSNYLGNGGDTPLGLGQGGEMPSAGAGASGVAGTNYGAGGSGGRNGTGTTSRTGGAGTTGVLIIEY